MERNVLSFSRPEKGTSLSCTQKVFLCVLRESLRTLRLNAFAFLCVLCENFATFAVIGFGFLCGQKVLLVVTPPHPPGSPLESSDAPSWGAWPAGAMP